MTAGQIQLIDWSRVWELREEIGQSEFLEVVALFLEETETMVDAIAGAPPEDLEAELHALKGASLNLGFARLADLSAAGERMAADGRGAEVAIGQVLGTFFRSRQEFQAGLDREGTG